MNNNNIDLQTILLSYFDSAPIGGFHVKITLAAGSGWLWAAYGTVVVGLIIPSLRDLWHISSSQLGLIASFNLAGMLVGAILAGLLADKFGRRRILASAVFCQGLFSLFSAFSWDYYSLISLRFLTGLGIGAVLPIASTLVGEFSPVKHRGRILVLLNGFWGLGVAVAALLGFLFIPILGWRSVLAFGGLAILFVPAVIHYLPESLRYLIEQGNYTYAIETVKKHFPSFNMSESLETDATGQVSRTKIINNHQRTVGIWSKVYAKRTLCLWLIWFSLNFLFQGIFVWLPSILMEGGQPMAKSLLFTMIIGLCQIPGSLIAAFIVEKVGRRVSMNIFFILFGIFSIFFGMANSPVEILVWGGLLGICNGATWGIAYPLTTELYPTRIRGTGAGWATGFGRAGGILAPFLVGMLLQLKFNHFDIYLLFAILCGLTSIAIFILREETKGRSLEEINQ